MSPNWHGKPIRVLHRIGKLVEVRDAVAQADLPTQELWLSPTFHRNALLLLAVAEVVGRTEQVDDLFWLAATL